MKTYQDFWSRKQPYGTRELKAGEFLEEPAIRVDEPLQNALFIMNRRNINLGHQAQSVDFDGCAVDPMDPDETMTFSTARKVYCDDYRATFDGFSLVLPNIPAPITTVNGKDFFLVAITINDCILKTQRTWFTNRENSYDIELTPKCKADLISLGSPLWSFNTTLSGIYIFALNQRPINNYHGVNKSVFSSGGVIAMNVPQDLKDPKTGKDLQIEILKPQAIKTIEKWRKEALSNDI